MPTDYYIQFILVFGVVIGGLVLALKFLRRLQVTQVARNMKIVDRLGVSNGIFMAIVSVQNKSYLIGVVNNRSIQVLDTLE